MPVVRSVKMKEEKMVALQRRNQGFFLPLHSITLVPPYTHAGFNDYKCMYQMLDSDKGWEFSTMILKARVIAETLRWELLGQGHFLNPISMDSQVFYKMRFFFFREFCFCIHSIGLMFTLLFCIH